MFRSEGCQHPHIIIRFPRCQDRASYLMENQINKTSAEQMKCRDSIIIEIPFFQHLKSGLRKGIRRSCWERFSLPCPSAGRHNASHRPMTLDTALSGSSGEICVHALFRSKHFPTEASGNIKPPACARPLILAQTDRSGHTLGCFSGPFPLPYQYSIFASTKLASGPA